MDKVDKSGYMTELNRRSKDSRVTRHFQLIGLEIATVLKDLSHKALYIKLSKEHNPEKLLALAKDVAERRDVKNPGAYFMKLVSEMKK